MYRIPQNKISWEKSSFYHTAIAKGISAPQLIQAENCESFREFNIIVSSVGIYRGGGARSALYELSYAPPPLPPASQAQIRHINRILYKALKSRRYQIAYILNLDSYYRGEWGKLSHPVSWATPLNSTKKAEEKMLMSSIVWSYSKDLLHHAALKVHLVVGKFQGKIILSHF